MQDIKQITAQLQLWINQMHAAGKNVGIDEINARLVEMMHAENFAPKDSFNGFSPLQMNKIVYFPLEEGCPVQLRRLSDEQVASIPFMRQVLHLMETLSAGEIKLTGSGYLPPRLVEELYRMGVSSWDTDWYKQKNEPKVEVVRILRVVVEECGLVKKRLGKMSLTAIGKKLLADRNELLRVVMLFLLRDYHTGWLDLVDDSQVANVGRLYSLWLLHRFGGEWQLKDFYARKYFEAFPSLDSHYYHSYGYRTFDRLFCYIGLCEINNKEADRGIEFASRVIKTSLLEKIFSFEEPGIGE